MTKITYPTFNLQQPGNAGMNVEQVLQQAIGLHRAGQLPQAEKNYQLVLQAQPRNAYALNMLGVLNAQKGEYKEGERLLRKAIKIDPEVADYYCNLGQCLLEQAKSNEAESAFKKTLRINPKYVSALFGLGNVCLQQKNPEKAIKYYKKTIEVDPRHLPACNNLGNLYREFKQYDDALNIFNQVLELKPDFAEGWYNIGLLHYINLDGRKAVDAFQKAIEIKPDYIRAYLKLGDSYGFLLNDLHAALTKYDYLLTLNSRYFPVFLHKASVYQAFGEFEEAEKILRQALDIDKSSLRVYQQLISGKTYSKKDISRIQSLLSEIDLDEKQLVTINFALGKSYDDQKDYETAYIHYQQANQLHRKTFEYFPEEYTRHVTGLIETFNSEFIREYSNYGSESEQMVFIVGMPRSGTTLTEQILASHPAVYGAGESEYMDQAYRKFASMYFGDQSTDDVTPECRKIGSADIHALANNYLAQVSPDENCLRITDKTPKNYQYLGVVAVLFPNAKIIHCQRNPLDTCLSIYFQHFASHHPYAYDLREIGQDYREYLRIMKYWRSVLGDRLLDIRYEDLVNNQEMVSRRLIKHINLPWDDACLQFSGTGRAIRTASKWQVRQQVYTESIDRWRHYEQWIGPLIDTLGDCVDNINSKKPK